MIALVVAEPHLAPARHVALLDVDGVADRLEHQRRLGNDQRIVVSIGLEEHAGEHAGPQPAVGRHLERGLDGAGGAVDHRAHAQHARVEALAGERLDGEVRALAHLEPAEVLLRHLDRALQRVERGDAEQRRRALHVLGELDEAGHDHPGEGSPDRGVVELHLGLVHLGARRFELRRRLIEQRAREDLLLVLRLGPLIGELGLALVDLGEREARADLGVVDARQQLPRLDLHPLLHQELDDRPDVRATSATSLSDSTVPLVSRNWAIARRSTGTTRTGMAADRPAPGRRRVRRPAHRPGRPRLPASAGRGGALAALGSASERESRNPQPPRSTASISTEQ